jgi:transketolase
MTFQFGKRRAVFIDIEKEGGKSGNPLSPAETSSFEKLDLIYRSMCALLFNYVPTSGHPGGSISAGRTITSLIFKTMEYDVSDPNREDADIISFAAGHKVMGLYILWALRDEMIRITAPELLPGDERLRFRLEDLLGFRRNPTTGTPLFRKFRARALDGHPTPATPFVRLSTGASGVGVASSIGLAFGAMDAYSDDPPYINIIEGEGGMTPGRVGESMAAAGSASLKNLILHVDWNQASIDSDRVCRENGTPGEYVQWDPMEFAYLHDWNVIRVPDGRNFQQILAAQRLAPELPNSQPTAIVYRTVKGWQYGIEGSASHGAGHKLCVEGLFQAVEPLLRELPAALPRCEVDSRRCRDGKLAEVVEECYWEALQGIRKYIEGSRDLVDLFAGRLKEAKARLDSRARKPRTGGPRIAAVYKTAAEMTGKIPDTLILKPGSKTTLRGELGRVLQYYNVVSGGGILAGSADLYGSTSVNTIAKGFPKGFYNAETNPGGRLLSVGGICEDAMAGILSGIASFGHHIPAGSSYCAFIAPLGHIACRLHAIGNQARQTLDDGPHRPFILICGHAGVKTGEDGPTHAEPQALQLLQGNFPQGTMITLTPWDPQELWPLITAALAKRPAVIAPFVTRPTETVPDRQGLSLPPATAATSGVYRLVASGNTPRGTVVLQGSEVAYAFVEETLPLLRKERIDLNVYYVASAELFDALSPEAQEQVFPSAHAQEAMGITGFTLPTMYRWVRSDWGRKMTLHPFQKGHYLGSGQGEKLLLEAGLDGESQFKAIVRYLGEI